jgi:hypothetical protein
VGTGLPRQTWKIQKTKTSNGLLNREGNMFHSMMNDDFYIVKKPNIFEKIVKAFGLKKGKQFMKQLVIQLNPIGQQNHLIGGKSLLTWMRTGINGLVRICLSTFELIFGRSEIEEQIEDAKFKVMTLSMRF